MILVKSLIVILFIVLAYFLYNKLYLLKKFDGREGFANEAAGAGASASEAGASASASEAGAGASEAAGAAIAELKYTPSSPLNKHKKMASDAEMMSDLQDKMNELFKLKEEAIVINNNLK